MCEDEHGGADGCRCRGGQLRSFLTPRLLLQLAEKPAHGYELMEVINQGDEFSLDPGSLYRLLRSMEEEGLVQSNWDTSGGGAARRIYQITDQGVDHLHAWMVSVRKTRQWLDGFLAAYEAYFSKDKEH